MLSFVKIVKIMVVGVCFAFKADVTVCYITAPVLNDANNILCNIPQVEKQAQHFFLLLGMNVLVVADGHSVTTARTIPDEYERPNTHRQKSLKWKTLVE